MSKLAIFGGEPAIQSAMPKRVAFGQNEITALNNAVEFYSGESVDPGYFGKFEHEYCEKFNQYMGGGYTTAVATGTAALYVAIAALELPKNSHIVMSPITDPGSFNAAVLQGFKVSLADTATDSLNTNWTQIEKVLTPETSAILLVHCAGINADIETIAKNAKARGIKLIEDCSQSPGAEVNGKKLGTFGDICALSTMYRKSLASGGSGGLVFTLDQKLHYKCLSYGDRGKDFENPEYQERNAEGYLFPALNWNTNELSCAIGIASLQRLDDTIRDRANFCKALTDMMQQSKFCTVPSFIEGTSPFFLTVYLEDLGVSKAQFCDALLGEGVELNPHYRFVISQWPWAKPYLTQFHHTPNAQSARDRSFNIYLNENYTTDTAKAIFAAIIKVENYFLDHLSKEM
ncbi:MULTISPECIES: DegT/DnrJ/EryC1/StrS family aminotransferase [Pseudoalteromonas]|uniref:DegT/DnrJ/EryC1/StrS family aminotransferase n=1 Tax=Pseudoalteromonas obscura TaxID=3048491 RepID=A0ABT7ETV2_9GAMM|nr:MULTISPECIES: DegT/DnrJ/EryC1/StrS family aminotransferase [Pseudoalteromonas]MBQ4836987.1 DegT/DnrJ/EryC1/StrS family aminotransferase [Pseudoalteromonas luteoviolacea]MDK2598428.1 DegT/DnrJ/EryC1/StrS family aminotransferase [Pseudoalteromonas sp. P94(2023)]